MTTPAPAASTALFTAVLAAALLLGGCVKPAEQKAPENTSAPQTEAFADAPAAPTQPPSVAGIPSAAIAAAERAKARVEIASTATEEQGKLYREAQALFAEKKFTEALAALDQLHPELFSPAQEKAVTELRAKIVAARAGS
jgi:hypothetical protein